MTATLSDFVAAEVRRQKITDDAWIEDACEASILTLTGVTVVYNHSGRVAAAYPDPDVPFGQIYAHPTMLFLDGGELDLGLTR